MQASKIIPGRVYAVRRGEKLLRFRVNEVNTITKRRAANRSPHDSRSEVVGWFHDVESNVEVGQRVTLAPDDIAGEYKEFAELVERKAREDAERKAREAEATKQAKADRLVLYKFAGLAATAKDDGYDQPFRVAFGKVEITSAGAKAIVERVRALDEEPLGEGRTGFDND